MLRHRAILGIFLAAGGIAVSALAEEGVAWEDSRSLLAPPRQWVSAFGHAVSEEVMGLPMAISSVTRTELDRAEYQNLQQSIRNTPAFGGASAEGLPTWWNPGVSLRGIGGPRVALLSQGAALLPQDLEVGDGGNLSLYDPFNVERVEIIRGAQPTQFGGSAMGGVINLVPRAPKQRDLFGVSVNGRSAFDGSVNAMRHSGLIDLGGQDFALVAGGSSVGSESPVIPSDSVLTTDGAYRTAAGWFNSRARLGDGTELRMRGEVNNSSDITLLKPASQPLPLPGMQSIAEVVSPQYRRSLLSAELSGSGLAAIIDSYRSSISWQRLERRTDSRLLPIEISPTSTDDTVQALRWNTVTTHQSDKNRFSVGYDLGVVGTDLDGGGVGDLPGGRLDATQYNSALFAEGLWAIDGFEVRPGGRFEYFAADDNYVDVSAHDIGASAGIAALYRWAEDRSLYLTATSGYRNPTLSERFYAGTVTGLADAAVLRGDSGISGERANSIEAGVKQTTAEYRIRLAAFYNRIENYIGISSSGTDASEELTRSLRYQNVSAVSVQGFELEASSQLTDELEFFGNLAQGWSSESEHIDLPALTANYGLRLQQDLCECASLRRFTGTVYARSVGSSSDRTSAMVAESFPRGESFTSLNFEGALEFATLPVGDLTLLFGARNIANSRYREPFLNQLQPGLTGYVALALAY